MTNLAKDVECGVVDPRRELKRLYPLQQPPTDMAAATATLYTHYAQERARSVNTQIPSDFWAGAEVLRAMAQYLREPLFIFDVDINNDTHAQQYYFQNYTTASGRPHESGCGGALDDQKALDLLQHYARLHVLPVMMVIKRHEGHFYGVHHGDLAARWLAEGDRDFAETNRATHPWFDDVIEHIEYSSPRMADVNRLDVTQGVDGILVGGLEHRDRLDVVHDRLGMPRLKSEALDIESLECGHSAEGGRLQKAAGPAHSGVEGRDDDHGATTNAEGRRRFPITSQGRVALLPLQRILDSIDLEPELVSDRSKLRQLMHANAKAVEVWCRQTAGGERPEQIAYGSRGLFGVMPWLLEHRPELHNVFSFIPYPELAAKQLPIKTIKHCGRLEAYDHMIATIKGVLHDEMASAAAAEHCRTWLAACTIHGGDSHDRTIAGERHRWARLQQLHPSAHLGARPENIQVGCWEVLQTLPFTLWAWIATAMGDSSRGRLGHFYSGLPAVRHLCELIGDRAEWGSAFVLQSGLTWDDRLTSMEAGLSASTNTRGRQAHKVARHTKEDEGPRGRQEGRSKQGGRRRAFPTWIRPRKALQRTLGDVSPSLIPQGGSKTCSRTSRM